MGWPTELGVVETRGARTARLLRACASAAMACALLGAGARLTAGDEPRVRSQPDGVAAEAGHGHAERSAAAHDLRNWDPALLARLRTLEGGIKCACPKENYTRTLAHCPDSCADPQKAELREMLLAGRTDEEALRAMIAEYGPKVVATPDLPGRGLAPYLIPACIFLGGALAACATYAILRRRRAAARATPGGAEMRVREEEIARVEKELEELA